jgi:adenylate cyclase
MTQTEAAARPVQFRRGLLSMDLKFSAFVGALLAFLLLALALIVNEELRGALIRESGERATTIAQGLAAKIAVPIITEDELSIGQLIKDGLRNEGLQGIIVTRLPLKAGEETETFKGGADGTVGLGEPGFQVPGTQPPDADLGEPFPGAILGGVPVYEIQAPIRGAGKDLGTLRLYLRKDLILDAVRRASARLATVMLGCLLAGLLLLWQVVRFLFGPIRPLLKGVNAVAAGDFRQRLASGPKDELGALIDAYNGMAKSLAEKESVQGALARYTSADLVKQMLSDSADLGLGGQKVHATVFFSVLRGVHALSQTLPAEDYVSLINEYLEVETAAIMRHQGTIDKFIGDEVMAVWLIPKDSPAGRVKEAAVRAVQACLDVQAGIAELNARRALRGAPVFQVSIGVNNGEVVSGNMGSTEKMDYTVLGGNVNLAARLGLVAAQGGQTILSQGVRDLVADSFVIDALPPVPLKGIKDPVPLFWPRAPRPGGGTA